MRVLNSPLRNYAWGSHTAIARMQGRSAPTSAPEAELWMGAHPDAPSRIDDVGLDKFIESMPLSTIGEQAAEHFGPRLPFLLKVIAADAPLSIQVHPNREQAASGYDAENRAGIKRSDVGRSYLDPYHKPELLVAYSPFEALCGLRDPADSAADLRRLRVPGLDHVVSALAAGDLRAAVVLLLAWPHEGRRELVAAAAAAAAASRLEPQAAAVVDLLAGAYPDDPGVVLSLLLNYVVLRPGDAIYVPAGQLHAYLRGTGIEIMSSSDNVLRGGLTRKHVDAAALVSVVDFSPARSLRLEAVQESDAVSVWPTPEPDFRLRRITLHGDRETATLDPAGPRIVFCAAGSVTAADRYGTVALSAGNAAFGAADGQAIRIHGTGDVFLASL